MKITVFAKPVGFAFIFLSIFSLGLVSQVLAYDGSPRCAPMNTGGNPAAESFDPNQACRKAGLSLCGKVPAGTQGLSCAAGSYGYICSSPNGDCPAGKSSTDGMYWGYNSSGIGSGSGAAAVQASGANLNQGYYDALTQPVPKKGAPKSGGSGTSGGGANSDQTPAGSEGESGLAKSGKGIVDRRQTIQRNDDGTYSGSETTNYDHADDGLLGRVGAAGGGSGGGVGVGTNGNGNSNGDGGAGGNGNTTGGNGNGTNSYGNRSSGNGSGPSRDESYQIGRIDSQADSLIDGGFRQPGGNHYGAPPSKGNDCDESEFLAGNTSYGNKSNCASTRSAVKTADLTNKGIQVTGAAATQVMGTLAQIKSQTDPNGVAGGLDATAKLQKTTGFIQMIGAAVNGFMGFHQQERVSGHEDTANAINNDVGNKDNFKRVDNNNRSNDGTRAGDDGSISVDRSNALAQKALTQVNQGKITAVNESLKRQPVNGVSPEMAAANQRLYDAQVKARDMDKDTKMMGVQSQTRQLADRGASEQQRAAQAAGEGAFMSFVAAGQGLMSGAFALLGAKQLEKASNDLKSIQTPAPIVAPVYSADATGNATGARPAQTITGSGTTASPSVADPGVAGTTGTPGDLGTPTPFIPQSGLTGPVTPPGSFVAKNGGGSPTGGGAGAGGGGPLSTPPAKADTTPPPAQLPYSSGSNSYTASGSPGGGGRSGDKAADLSGLLGGIYKMMAGGDAKEAEDGAGIKKYGRNIASEGTAGVGQDTNLFRRVTQTYNRKQSEGKIGFGI